MALVLTDRMKKLIDDAAQRRAKILALHEDDGMSMASIARSYSITPERVRQMISRARRDRRADGKD